MKLPGLIWIIVMGMSVRNDEEILKSVIMESENEKCHDKFKTF